MSKWFGGILLILVILSLPFLIGLLIFIFDSRISLSNNDLIAILLILSFSFIYLAIFYSIGVLVSTATLDSSRSLLISIFIWLFFILLVPNFGHYLAEYLFKIPSRDIIEHNLAQIEKERQDEIQKAIKPYILSQNISEAEALKIAGIEEINKKYNEKSQKIYSNYKSKVKALTRIVRAINIISPTSCFIYSLTEISHTGQEAKEDFERQKEEYLRIYRNYVLKKYREELEKNPKFSVMDKLDLSEIPTFAFKERTLSERLSTIYIYILSMLFWLFLFLILSIFIIQRSDVR
jgi:ABC-type transport system involved in multi-copper enzyme maturation permease subunit